MADTGQLVQAAARQHTLAEIQEQNRIVLAMVQGIASGNPRITDDMQAAHVAIDTYTTNRQIATSIEDLEANINSIIAALKASLIREVAAHAQSTTRFEQLASFVSLDPARFTPYHYLPSIHGLHNDLKDLLARLGEIENLGYVVPEAEKLIIDSLGQQGSDFAAVAQLFQAQIARIHGIVLVQNADIGASNLALQVAQADLATAQADLVTSQTNLAAALVSPGGPAIIPAAPAANAAPAISKFCGDNGGVTNAGNPCKKQVQAGLTRCHMHKLRA